MNTGIKQLDRLLGYSPEKDEGGLGSIPLGSVVLIRGQPGSGKTTLALQIVNKYLAGGRRKAVFISLESDPERTIDHAYRTFAFENFRRSPDCKIDRLAEIGRDELWNSFNYQTKESTDAFAQQFIECIAKSLPGSNIKGPNVTDESEQILIFVDSLLLFADIASQKLKEPDIRGGLNCVRHCAKSKLKHAYIIFTGEYYQQQTILAESFYCDIEILLSPEPIAGGTARPVTTFSPIGYSIERIISPLNPAQAIVSRSFCRVLKNRSWPNHSRRCAYDIVDGHGIVFYETYPGDGQLVLFNENTRQKQNWTEFLENEVPYRYPSMRSVTFDQSALQRIFASQRALKDIPERVDLYMTSLDTYWINWYIEFCQRGDIFGILQKHFPRVREGLEPHVPRLISRIHEICLSGLHDPSQATDSMQAMFAKYWKDNNLELTDDEAEVLPVCVGAIVLHFSKNEAYQGILLPIRKKHLRLFGEHSSEFINALNVPHINQRRPIHCLKKNPNAEFLLSVPYDANVSFMLYRTDLLEIKSDAEANKTKQAILRIYKEDREIIAKFLERYEYQNWVEEETELPVEKTFSQDFVAKAVDRLVRQIRYNHSPPSTWEEIIALCEVKKVDCLIETRTFDTFTTTFLELLWNCGGDLEITPRYQILNRAISTRRLFHAICLLHRMFAMNIIPKYCSLEPSYMNKRYGIATRLSGEHNPDWLFARHWYSTCVDLLTRKDVEPVGDKLQWLQEGARLEIMRIPLSLHHYLEQRGNATSETDIVHTSAWGEWHLAVHEGSENKALALDLINSLMSSSKICDRAFSNAALPTVEKFYERYGKVNCLNVPERPLGSIPTWTFRNVYDRIFPFAKSRSQIFDYRNCMREIHSVLESVHALRHNTPLDLTDDILRALRTITNFESKRLMLS